jgi:plasmid maintenance system antidote protein VapI
MTLAEYLQLNGLTHDAFAEKSGVPRPTVTRLVKPGARPDWDNMERIRKATGGKVSPNDWASMQAAS